MEPFAGFETERLAIRRYEAGDVAFFRALRADPDVRRFQSFADLDAAAAAAAISEMAAEEPARGLGWINLCIVDRRSGAPVGDLGLARIGASVEIGYTLVAEARGQGFATEAVGGLLAWLAGVPGVATVAAELDARNAASRRVLTRLGFRLVRRFVEEGDPPVPVEAWERPLNVG
jgi:RimJ/RimL family protein N-acetyltransferase